MRSNPSIERTHDGVSPLWSLMSNVRVHMNAARITTIALFCLATVWDLASAGDTHYEYTVVSAVILTEQGTLSPHWTNMSMIGVKFTVDRVTGRIIGGPLDNANLKTEVIDKGSREMPFQAFSRSTQKTHTAHIEIDEFALGVEKPFFGTTTLYYPGMYSGICK